MRCRSSRQGYPFYGRFGRMPGGRCRRLSQPVERRGCVPHHPTLDRGSCRAVPSTRRLRKPLVPRWRVAALTTQACFRCLQRHQPLQPGRCLQPGCHRDAPGRRHIQQLEAEALLSRASVSAVPTSACCRMQARIDIASGDITVRQVHPAALQEHPVPAGADGRSRSSRPSRTGWIPDQRHCTGAYLTPAACASRWT